MQDETEYPWHAYADQIASVVVDGPSSVGDMAFYNDYYALTSVSLGEGLTRIGRNAFGDCVRLSQVSLPDSLVTIGGRSFANTAITDITIPDGVTTIDGEAFYGSALTAVTIPNSVTSLGSGAFSNCARLQSVVLSENIEVIGMYAFSNCTNLTSIVIPGNVKSISDGAFSNCMALVQVTFSEGLEQICASAFEDCLGLTGLVIPSTVNYLGNPFPGCYLTTLTFLGDAPQIPDENTFLGMFLTAYYPADNPTWTEDIMLDYGGTLTWVPYGFGFITQPESQTVLAGETAVFTVEVNGEVQTYQWQYSTNGKYWFDSGMPGANTAALQVVALAKRNGQQYRYIITDAYGNTVTSATVTLTIH